MERQIRQQEAFGTNILKLMNMNLSEVLKGNLQLNNRDIIQ